MLLIVTNGNDTHADNMERQLEAASKRYLRINTEEILAGVHLTTEIGKGGFHHFMQSAALSSVLDEITAVWFRRPLNNFSVSRDLTSVDAAYVSEETTSYLNGLWETLGDCRWVNRPWSGYRASRKLHQLKIAHELGFTIPNTLVTSEPTKALAFFEACRGDVVVKALSRGLVDTASGVEAVFTSRVTRASLDHINAISYCPTLLQERVSKESDLRITVVGERVFACVIRSQDDIRASLDWRKYQNVHHEPIQLPQALEDQCVALVQSLDLAYGAIDMAKSSSGEFVFFEINPSGQYLGIEQKTGLPITRALIDQLIS